MKFAKREQYGRIINLHRTYKCLDCGHDELLPYYFGMTGKRNTKSTLLEFDADRLLLDPDELYDLYLNLHRRVLELEEFKHLNCTKNKMKK
jgi:hypothetical protein